MSKKKVDNKRLMKTLGNAIESDEVKTKEDIIGFLQKVADNHSGKVVMGNVKMKTVVLQLPKSKIEVDLIFYNGQNPDVDVADAINVYRYGKSPVPLDEAEFG